MAVGWVQVIASLLRGELPFVPCFANSSAYDVESLMTVRSNEEFVVLSRHSRTRGNEGYTRAQLMLD